MSKILVFVETRDDKLKSGGLEALSAANSLSKELNAEIEAIIIGGNVSELVGELGKFGATRVIICENERLKLYSASAYSKIIEEAVKRRNANYVFLSATSMGRDLAPRIAARCEAGLAVDCINLKTENSEIIATRPVYAGKAFIEVKINSEIKIFSLRPNVFKKETSGEAAPETETLNVNLSDNDYNTSVKEITVNTGKIDVAEATVIVSGGRGLKGPENFHLVEDLAKVLNGAVGASRAVVDAGWRNHAEQVGQTGKTVSPTLYIACGISGAIQHLAGMSSSKCIVAINKDKDAPIFSVADYGIVGDVLEILPALTEEFKKAL